MKMTVRVRLCRISHSYALLRRIASSMVVCHTSEPLSPA